MLTTVTCIATSVITESSVLQHSIDLLHVLTDVIATLDGDDYSNLWR